jgi:hypothetical protein
MGCGFFIFFNKSLGGVKKAPMRDRAVWCEAEEKIAEQLQELDWVDVEIKAALKQHNIEYFDIPAYLDSEIKRECEIQAVLRKKRRKKKAIDMLLRAL